MRFDQYNGLNKWARRTVRATKLVREIGKQIQPNGEVVKFDRTVKVPVVQKRRYSKIRGTYVLFAGDLHRYTLPNGKVLEEYVQETLHCGGPCYFIALRDGNGKPEKRSLWTRSELDKATTA